MKNEDKMGTKNILPLLVEFSIPAIIGMLVNAIYNIVDRMFIGNAPKLGSIGLAGISIRYSCFNGHFFNDWNGWSHSFFNSVRTR